MGESEETTESPEAGDVSQPQVSIIMRSMNEQPYTEQTLTALEGQTFKDYALLNVDSGSTDGTLEVVQRFNTNPEAITQIAAGDYVPGTVLNMMIEKTVSPITVFLNADAIPQDSMWLEKLLGPILADEADATMSVQIPRDSAHFIVKYDMARGYDPKNIPAEASDAFSAVSCAFKRTLWEKTKFYTEGYAEDLAWAKECHGDGARFRLVQDSVVEHSHNYTLGGLYRKRYRHGIAFTMIYDAKPQLFVQVYQWAKENVRDFIYAIKSLRPDTIPYNILCRSIIHYAYYMGKRAGRAG